MRLTSVRTLLAASTDALTDADRNDFALSVLWAQSVALTVSTDPGSDSYDRALTAELSRIAWNVTAAETVAYDAAGGTLAPGAALRKLLNPYLGADQDGGLAALLDAIGGGTVGSQLGGFLSTWWAQQDSGVAASAFAVGPLARGSAGLSATILFYACDLRIASWQSFFLVMPDRRFRLTARPITLTLNEDLFRSIEPAIAAKLGEAAARYIRNLDIDL